MTDPHVPDAVADGDIATAWLRLTGFVVDIAILFSVGVLLAAVLGVDLDPAETADLPARFRVSQGLFGAAYYIGFTSSRGQTPGKMFAGTRVVMEETAEIPGPRPATLRWFLPGVFTFLPGLSIIQLAVYVWVPFDNRRRGLHDKAAKTVVIKTRRRRDPGHLSDPAGNGAPAS